MANGQSTFSGINSQAWAAMSLFLQFLRDPNFVKIHLEAPQFQDFNLIFDDGKKIVCESKDRKETFNYAHLKEILENLASKKSISSSDEILIICRGASKKLQSEISNIKYLGNLKKKFAKKGYSNEALSLLQNVKFWIVPSAFNEEVIYSLFSELINFWLPPEEIKRFVNSLLIEKIYKGSAKGGVFTRREIFNEIEKFKSEVQQGSDYFNLKIRKDNQFKLLEKIVKSKGKIELGSRSISAFSIRWDLMSFAIDRLKLRNDLDLKKWDDLWQVNTVQYLSFGIFHVFGNNLSTHKNRKYILSYIKKYTKIIRGFYRWDYFDTDVVKIISKIVNGKDGTKYLNASFEIVKDLILFNEKRFFYIKNINDTHVEWEKGEICKLLYNLYKISDHKLKQKIVKLAMTAFNITEDDGTFSHYAPSEIFEIIRDWLKEDFLNRFNQIVKVAVGQYDKFYKKFSSKVQFKGWEHMGGGISFGGGYHVDERHFVLFVLTPAIREFYDKDTVNAWKFIKNRCVIPRKKVSKTRPDFLNRAVYEIVLRRYADEDTQVSEEAFNILKEWLLSKRGIPHKSDFIYQSVKGWSMPPEKKWRLVEITLKEYKIPVNVFVEQIVADLAKKDFLLAKLELESWYKNNKYFEQSSFMGNTLTNIRELLDTDFEKAVSLFKAYITSEYFISLEKDRFQSYEWATLLNEIVRKSNGVAIEILKSLAEKETLSQNEQRVFCYGLFNYHGSDSSDDLALLMRVHDEVVDPFLNRLENNIDLILKKLTETSSREGLVKFAERLATHKKIAEAMRMVKIFIKDPDPYLPEQDPDTDHKENNEHQRILNGKDTATITTVRGWCCWVLMKCSILAGRDYIPEIIDIVKELSEDPNYYIMHMSCFPLDMLGKNRLTVLPDNKEILFFGDDVETALKRSKQVESIIFNLLERLKNAPPQVQKVLIKSVLTALNNIRAVNEKEAEMILGILRGLPEETLQESAAMFVYCADYRQNSYKDWKWKRPGFYDDLDQWDNQKFEKIIEDTIREVKDPANLSRFAILAEKMVRDNVTSSKESEEEFTRALKYLDLVSERYSHHLFTIIYMAIKQVISQDKDFNRWFNLYIKCLNIESNFYKEALSNPENSKDQTYRGMYWWPSFYNFEILEQIHRIAGKEKFLQTAEIIFSFPKEFEIHETDNIISFFKEYRQDRRAQIVFKVLLEKNPSKYWELKNFLGSNRSA